MKNIALFIVGLALTGVAVAAPPTYLEFAYITGGENNNRVSGEADGFEFAGSWGIDENWYAGGIIGSFENDGPDIENDYFNINLGYAQNLDDMTTLALEGGLWFGEESQGSVERDPRAIEAKAALSRSINEKLGVFGRISLVGGDLDRPTDDDLSNFIWSLGGYYNFTDTISMNVKLVDGVNGVNGQDEVLRIGGRWTF